MSNTEQGGSSCLNREQGMVPQTSTRKVSFRRLGNEEIGESRIAVRGGGQLSVSAPQAMNIEQGGGGLALGNGVLVTGSMRNREQETVPQPSTRKVSFRR